MRIDDQPPTEPQKEVDWTGLVITAALSPVFFAFAYIGKAELGFTVLLVSSIAVLAIKLRWKLRKYSWFWGTIALLVAIHLPLVTLVQWPHTNTPTILYSMPLGIADFLLISGAISLAERLFLKHRMPDDKGS